MNSKRSLIRKNQLDAGLAKDDKMISLLEEISDAVDSNRKEAEQQVPDVPRLRMRRDKVYTFSRSYSGPVIAQSTTISTFGSLSVSLNQVSNVTEFTALFDQYRITQACVRFIPISLNQSTSALYTVIDYDDAVVPTGLNYLLEYTTLRVSSGTALVERCFSPKFTIQNYISPVLTGYAMSTNRQWVDVASPDTAYYGLKYGLPALTGALNGNAFTTVITLVLQFKNPR